jgi:hypothetical protein
MNTARGTQLVTNFLKELNTLQGINVSKSSISRNVFKFRYHNKSLLYIKGRAQKPYRWGVTANVIDRLHEQPIKWYVILLFESHEKGYLLNSQDVDYYIKNVWPLGQDGDYKPATGSYLSKNSAIYSIKEFIKIID